MLGIHVHKKSIFSDITEKSMVDAIKRDVNLFNINCIQIYTHGPRNTRKNNIDYSAIKKIKIPIYIHASYLTASIWKGHTMHLAEQLYSCKILEAKGLVVHLPKADNKIIIHIIKKIYPTIKKYKIPLLLETPSFVYDHKKLNNLCEKIKKYVFIEICIDTAHLWSSGIKDMNGWLCDFKYPQKIKLCHLNGSAKILYNTGIDKHTILFSKQDGINAKATPIIQFCNKNKIPMICEINRGKEIDAKKSFAKIHRILKTKRLKRGDKKEEIKKRR